ncbi:MAG: site-specific DNA-methyltransferase [Sphingobium sp.]
MDKLKMHSPDLSQDNIAKIRALFPDCVTEAADDQGTVRLAVDFDQLRQLLSDHIVEGPQERYRLDWPGKREALLTANAPIAKTLRPCRDESVDFDTTQNLFIEGDNLDALKLLQESYLGKVKLIYIDPPYNTGNDFIYADDFAEKTSDFLVRSNQSDESGGRLTANNSTNGRFHSDWLSMMYARLKLARNVLRPDGVIFISIDDNEANNLRKICDEVFGEENFVSQIVWQRSKKGDAKLIAKVHEYILCYVRDKLSVVEQGIWRRPKDGAQEVLEKYSELRSTFASDHDAIRAEMQLWYKQLPNDDQRKAHKHYSWSDDRGLYFADNFAGPDDGRASRPRHEILHPTTGKSCKKPSTGWRWDESKTEWALKQTPPRIHFGPDESTIPNRKSYLFEIDSEPFSSVFYRDGRSATLEVEQLVGKGWFPFPKNTEVLADLISLVTGDDDIIVDFFAGSGSTAHAIMKLNAAYGSGRRFVLIQLPEDTGRPEYPTIAEISKQRLIHAGTKVLEGECHERWNRDVGFRVLKVDNSNMSDVFYHPDEVRQDGLFGQVDSVKSDRTAEDLLFQVLIDWGVELTLPINRETLHGKTVYSVDGNALIACFETGVTDELIKDIAARAPLRAVFRDTSFARDADRINAEQLFRQLSPGTELKAI